MKFYLFFIIIGFVVILTLDYFGYFDFWTSVGIKIFGREGFLWWESEEIGSTLGIVFPIVVFFVFSWLWNDDDSLGSNDELSEEKKSTIFKCVLCGKVYKIEDNYYNHFKDSHKYKGDTSSNNFKDKVRKDLEERLKKEEGEKEIKRKSECATTYFKISYDIEYDKEVISTSDLILWFAEEEIRNAIESCTTLENYWEETLVSTEKNWKKEEMVMICRLKYHKPSLLLFQSNQLNKDKKNDNIDIESFGSIKIRHKKNLNTNNYSATNYKISMQPRKPGISKVDTKVTVIKIIYDIEYDPDSIDPNKLSPQFTKRMGSFLETCLSESMFNITPKNNLQWKAERRVSLFKIYYDEKKFDPEKIIIGEYPSREAGYDTISNPQNYFMITDYIDRKINVDPNLIDIDIEIEKYKNRIPVVAKINAENAENAICLGSGFVISKNGLIATNYHVVDVNEYNISKIEIGFPEIEKKYEVSIINKDIENDLAILKIKDESLPEIFKKEIPYKLNQINTNNSGQEIYTVGYPLKDLMGQNSSFTDGTISSPFGINEDPRHFQLSFPIQSGNIGGPVFNKKGELTGLIVSLPNEERVKEIDGPIPQNVNLAIKSSYISPLLDKINRDLINQNNLLTGLSLEAQVSFIEPFTCQVIRYL